MMDDNFDLTPRNLVFEPAMVGELPSLVAAYGAVAADVGLQGAFPVVFARWDDQEQTRLRAASHATEVPTVLRDGRLAVEKALFTRALLAAVAAGVVPAVEMSGEELEGLRAT